VTQPLRLGPVAAVAWMVSVFLALLGASPGQEAQAGPGAPVTLHGNTPLFAPAADCMACHNNIATSAGEDVSLGTTWRSSMMANSARDPYWHAGVRRETIDHPEHAEAIQNECAMCHMPIATRLAHQEGRLGSVFEHLGGATETDRLALEGIACSVCHQISEDGLGTPENFNGRFVMRPSRADGVREILGPFEVDEGRRTIMRSSSGGFEQVEAPHIRESEVCATCHTLITDALGPDGEVVGRLPEQMNYQEWLHSDFPAEAQSCQSCHMPRVDEPIRVASVLGDERDGLSRHTFLGGNAFMVRMLNRFRTELGVEALPAELEATARATELQLRERTATLALENVSREGGTLGFDVAIGTLTGHKFPTGYPSRRTWMHVVVRDAADRVVFESGRVGADGAIAGNANDEDGTSFEPHYARITSGDQVQIYETILGAPDGQPTTGLLTAVRYLKDNRLLPRGFDKATADPDIGVYGAAVDDATFTGGGDRVRYEIALAESEGPLRIEATLRYQSIGYRWAHNLESYDAPEPQRFLGYYNAMSEASSSLVGTVAMTVDQ